MRVLFVSHAEKTHYFSMVPLAWALRAAGHEVRVASQPELAPAIVESGLVAVPVGADHKWKQMMEEKADDSWTQRVGKVIADSSNVEWAEFVDFLDESTRDYLAVVNNDEFIDDLVAYAREWRPDLIVWEQLSWAGAIAARASGAAHARFLWGADVMVRIHQDFRRQLAEQPPEAQSDPLVEWLTGALSRHGCDFVEEVVTGQWTIDTAPPSHRRDYGLRTIGMRYVPYNGPAALPDWLREPPALPRVAVTAGVSVRHYFGVDLISLAALHMFADLEIEVIATLLPAPGESPADAPANATVLDFVPMQGLLPTCSAVMHIGGAGVQSTALHYGVPQLILPGLWDTELRAAQVVESGAGLAIPPHEASPERIRGDLVRLLNEPGFAEAAERLRLDAQSAPSPAAIVPDLERLAAEHA
ncbi:MAG TPA: activator-dependent family glycosyltransferase [Actinophytocola sp.]|uniref:activator-dependent family glycosyltransferase n=1 Tax=Actinophytocola sp. TaxID=1872138 RepID=UPI002DB5DE3F|nr:activator-dependent family glycosyltransferase [Actinophytocola sp.]HEU5471629.1 activator-dependent family glycosyltransferase [Actinophytocola sp.]